MVAFVLAPLVGSWPTGVDRLGVSVDQVLA